MILTNAYNRYKVSPVDVRKLLSIPNPYYTQGMKELTIDGKLYCQVNTAYIYFPPTTPQIVNTWLTGVIMEGFIVRMSLSSMRPHTGMSTFE